LCVFFVKNHIFALFGEYFYNNPPPPPPPFIFLNYPKSGNRNRQSALYGIIYHLRLFAAITSLFLSPPELSAGKIKVLFTPLKLLAGKIEVSFTPRKHSAGKMRVSFTPRKRSAGKMRVLFTPERHSPGLKTGRKEVFYG
jgi:hypothetical protein